MHTITTKAVVRELKTIFARSGIPEILVTDNDPQFAFKEFEAFAKSWSFNHTPTSPRYPQSNGKAENAVKTVKRLFQKCKESGVSEFQALLDWRNTPTEGMATSPAQRLMGRRCRTLLPTSECLLRPSYSLRDDVRAKSVKFHQFSAVINSFREAISRVPLNPEFRKQACPVKFDLP